MMLYCDVKLLLFSKSTNRKLDVVSSCLVKHGAVALRFWTVLRETIHKLPHFHWLLPRLADSAANKNGVISVLSYVGPS